MQETCIGIWKCLNVDLFVHKFIWQLMVVSIDLVYNKTMVKGVDNLKMETYSTLMGEIYNL